MGPIAVGDDSPTLALAAARELEISTPSGLRILASVSAQSPVVQKFYEGYDRAFVLPNEREELAGFIECLELNDGAAFQRLARMYGPFREVVFVAFDAATNDYVGGGNFIAYPLLRPQPSLALNLNYVFVNPTARRQGYFAKIVQSVVPTAQAFFHDAPPLPARVFIEQNDPFKMTAEAYARDTEYTGLDQFTRLAMWQRLGAKIIDFDYVQPPLSAQQEPDTTLVYAVLGENADTLDACVLHDHLMRFFGISVIKGRSIAADATADRQLKALYRLCAKGEKIALLDFDQRVKGSIASSMREALGSVTHDKS